MGNEQAHIVQTFQTLATIVSQAFGDKKPTGPGSTGHTDVFEPTTGAEMQTAFKSVFG